MYPYCELTKGITLSMIFFWFHVSQLPENGVSPLLDVLVYFHGGAFMFGSGGIYTPDYILMNNDVVIVFVNYRLGPLGMYWLYF